MWRLQPLVWWCADSNSCLHEEQPHTNRLDTAEGGVCSCLHFCTKRALHSCGCVFPRVRFFMDDQSGMCNASRRAARVLTFARRLRGCSERRHRTFNAFWFTWRLSCSAATHSFPQAGLGGDAMTSDHSESHSAYLRNCLLESVFGQHHMSKRTRGEPQCTRAATNPPLPLPLPLPVLLRLPQTFLFAAPSHVDAGVTVAQACNGSLIEPSASQFTRQPLSSR